MSSIIFHYGGITEPIKALLQYYEDALYIARDQGDKQREAKLLQLKAEFEERLAIEALRKMGARK